MLTEKELQPFLKTFKELGSCDPATLTPEQTIALKRATAFTYNWRRVEKTKRECMIMAYHGHLQRRLEEAYTQKGPLAKFISEEWMHKECLKLAKKAQEDIKSAHDHLMDTTQSGLDRAGWKRHNRMQKDIQNMRRYLKKFKKAAGLIPNSVH